MSIDDIEATETVHDPAGGAPTLPFGHLNAAWLALRAQMRQGDVLWQFEIPAPTHAANEASSTGGIGVGYALFRDGKPCVEIIAHARDDFADEANSVRQLVVAQRVSEFLSM